VVLLTNGQLKRIEISLDEHLDVPGFPECCHAKAKGDRYPLVAKLIILTKTFFEAEKLINPFLVSTSLPVFKPHYMNLLINGGENRSRNIAAIMHRHPSRYISMDDRTGQYVPIISHFPFDHSPH